MNIGIMNLIGAPRIFVFAILRNQFIFTADLERYANECSLPQFINSPSFANPFCKKFRSLRFNNLFTALRESLNSFLLLNTLFTTFSLCNFRACLYASLPALSTPRYLKPPILCIPIAPIIPPIKIKKSLTNLSAPVWIFSPFGAFQM